MINLLPELQKRRVKSEYHKRVFSVIFFSVSLTIFLSVGMLTPSFIVSREEYLSLVSQKEGILAKSLEGGNKNATSTIKDLNQKLSILRIGKSQDSISLLINSIIDKKDKNIAIHSITYEKRGATAKIDLSGIAKTRESIVSFVEELKKEKSFSEVYSPVSNLVKDRDIEFNVQIAVTPI